MTFVIDKSGNNPTDVRFPKQTPLGDFQVTVTGVSQSLVALLAAASFVLPAAAQYVVLTIEGVNIRYRIDNTAPTASVGNLVQAGSAVGLAGDLTKLKMISTGANATVDVSLYDRGLGWAS